MWNPKRIGTLVVGFALAMAVLAPVARLALAEGSLAPSQLVNNYLTSLIVGDTQQLTECIAGPMAQKNPQLVLSPDAYSQFLRRHYAGVQTTVEEVIPEGSGMHARVRFDRPGSDSSVIVFVLGQVDGQWKITDEIF